MKLSDETETAFERFQKRMDARKEEEVKREQEEKLREERRLEEEQKRETDGLQARYLKRTGRSGMEP